MTIDEAIKNLQTIIENWDYFGEKGYAPALQLALEALKRLQDTRAGKYIIGIHTLPGETE